MGTNLLRYRNFLYFLAIKKEVSCGYRQYGQESVARHLPPSAALGALLPCDLHRLVLTNEQSWRGVEGAPRAQTTAQHVGVPPPPAVPFWHRHCRNKHVFYYSGIWQQHLNIAFQR